MSGALPPLHMFSWHVQEQLHLLHWQYIKVIVWNMTQCRYYVLEDSAVTMLRVEDGGSQFFGILVHVYQTTQSYIPEDCNVK